MHARGELLRAVFHVRHTFDRKRVGRQIGRSGGLVEAVVRLQTRKEASHAVGVESCGVERAKSHAVGLAFGVLRVVELGLNHRRLRAHGDRRRGVSARIAACAGGENGQQQRAERERKISLLSLDHARDVALGNVSDFVAHHAREFAFGLGGNDGARMHGDEAAGQREGVEARVADREEKEVVGVRRRVADELIADAVEILRHLGVVHVGGVGADLLHELLAERVLVGGREFGARRGAEARQIEVERRAAGRRIGAERRDGERERSDQRGPNGMHGHSLVKWSDHDRRSPSERANGKAFPSVKI